MRFRKLAVELVRGLAQLGVEQQGELVEVLHALARPVEVHRPHARHAPHRQYARQLDLAPAEVVDLADGCAGDADEEGGVLRRAELGAPLGQEEVVHADVVVADAEVVERAGDDLVGLGHALGHRQPLLVLPEVLQLLPHGYYVPK